MTVRPIRTRVFLNGDDLSDFIFEHVKRISERSILVVTSKIVSLSEGRVSDASDEKTRVRLIKEESQWAMKTKYTWLTIKDNTVMAAAGIDQSNANGKLILLPKDSFRTALELRKRLRKRHHLRALGVLITDSWLMPLRAGVVGMALGYAGFRGIRDYRGAPDLFGRKLKISRTDVADSLATAAVLTMGEAAERRPLALIEGAPVVFLDQIRHGELSIDIKEDVYQPLFQKIRRISWKKKM